MKIDELIEKLELQMERLINTLPERKRPFFEELDSKFANRAILLYGPRGTGKTTYLLLRAKQNNMLYVSGDDIRLLQHSFYEIAEEILKNYSGIIIDEVHAIKNWEIIAKNIYDSFPSKKIWLSDSSSVILRKGVADLSRRFVVVKLPLMSLREYICFETGKLLPKIENTFEERSFDMAKEILKEIDAVSYFKKYKEHGSRPFYLEGNFREKMLNIVEKTIYHDTISILGNISENHYGAMKAMITHLLFSKIPTINIETMSKEWGIGKPKLYQLLQTLEDVEMINVVDYTNIEKAYTKGAKILLADPTLYYVYEGETGNFREAFVVSTLKEKDKILACKDETKGDFIFNQLTLEVGGKNKKPKESDFVIRDDIDIPFKNIIPLWMLGMMW
ncbi:MAG: AAA family ATPase [Pseudothermotoga sp.]